MPDLDLEALEKLLAEATPGEEGHWFFGGISVLANMPALIVLRNAAPALIAAARERDALRDELQRVRDIGLANLEREKRHVPADAVLEGLANDLQDANKDRYALREQVKLLADALKSVLPREPQVGDLCRFPPPCPIAECAHCQKILAGYAALRAVGRMKP